MSAARPLSGITRSDLEPLWSRLDIPTRVIAERLGVTRQGLSCKAQALGLPSRGRNRMKFSDDDLFRRMWNAGVCSTEMAAHFGYSHRSAVGTRRRALGLPRRVRGRDVGTPSGWIGTISIAEFWEMELGRKMVASAKGRGG